MIKKYNTVLDEEPFVSKTVKSEHPNLRLYKMKPRIKGFPEKGLSYCWHCGEDIIHKLIWCHECYFYVVNNYNDLEYVEPAKPIEFTV